MTAYENWFKPFDKATKLCTLFDERRSTHISFVLEHLTITIIHIAHRLIEHRLHTIIACNLSHHMRQSHIPFLTFFRNRNVSPDRFRISCLFFFISRECSLSRFAIRCFQSSTCSRNGITRRPINALDTLLSRFSIDRCRIHIRVIDVPISRVAPIMMIISYVSVIGIANRINAD